jgi:outer membrane protein assembly factor BamB
MTQNRILLPATFLAFASSLFANIENWPGWRGPRGDGSSLDSKVPAKWSLEKNLVWKTPIPGKGHASPIVWEDRVYLVTALEDTEQRTLLCLDRKSGKILWKKDVLKSPFEGVHRLNSRASSTPVTDGKRIFVSFLDRDSMFVSAYDMDGKELWTKRPGSFSSKHGYCSSPILWKEKVIINGDQDGDAYLVALDQESGKEFWKTMRPNKTRSYCTPIIRNIAGRNQMILSGSLCVASYDPDTGKQHWIVDGPTEQYVASLVYNGEYLFMTCGFPKRFMQAIDPTGSGNVTETHVKWITTKGCSYVPSPISIGKYFLVVADNGVASCFDSKSGERYWMERLPGDHNASIISANGLAYFLSKAGVMTVIKPGPEFQVVSENKVPEETNASPAVYDGQIFIRGDKHLYCIGG